MKKTLMIFLGAMVLPLIAYATLTNQNGVLRADSKHLLNKMNAVAVKTRLGNVLDRQVGSAIGRYNFATQGGAVGAINLLDDDGNALKLPANALITNVVIDVVTQLTSGGAATIAVGAAATADLLAATAVASWTVGRLQGIPDWATVADMVKLSAEQTLDLTIATAALTAGKFNVHVQYVYSE